MEERSRDALRRKAKERMPLRGVPRRDEFFAKIGLARSFISGPADHSIIHTWFGVKSVRKISIRVKGNIEILRHHRSEKHLRRDQRWPYEHLKSADSITQKTQHRVRGRNGKILTKIEVTKDILKIIPVEPVDFGERFLFYDDSIHLGRTTAVVTPESRDQANTSEQLAKKVNSQFERVDQQGIEVKGAQTFEYVGVDARKTLGLAEKKREITASKTSKVFFRTPNHNVLRNPLVFYLMLLAFSPNFAYG